LIERQVFAVHEHGSTGELMQLGKTTDVIDVGVRADDGFDGEFVAAEEGEEAFDFVTGIDDQSFAGNGIADDGAIAMEHPDGDGDLNDAGFRLLNGRGFFHVVAV
jgi:hypothetical protein